MRNVVYCLFSLLLFCGFSAYGGSNAVNASGNVGLSFNTSAYCKEIKDVKIWATKLDDYSDDLDMLRTVHFHKKYIKIRGKKYKYSQFSKLPNMVVESPVFANNLMSNLLNNWDALVALKDAPTLECNTHIPHPHIHIHIPHPHILLSSDSNSGWQAVCNYLFKGSSDSSYSCSGDFKSNIPYLALAIIEGLVEGFAEGFGD